VIDALYVASEHSKAEELYVEMLERGLTLSQWSINNKGMLDFHDFSEGMAAAAMRIVLRDMMPHKAGVTSSSSSNTRYVHPIAKDLRIITGHALKRQEKDGSVLQRLVMNMLKQLKIECSIDAHNKGMVIAKSGALQELAARNATMHQKRKQ
jgi:pentatricopeptide repeat protein